MPSETAHTHILHGNKRQQTICSNAFDSSKSPRMDREPTEKPGSNIRTEKSPSHPRRLCSTPGEAEAALAEGTKTKDTMRTQLLKLPSLQKMHRLPGYDLLQKIAETDHILTSSASRIRFSDYYSKF